MINESIDFLIKSPQYIIIDKSKKNDSERAGKVNPSSHTTESWQSRSVKKREMLEVSESKMRLI